MRAYLGNYFLFIIVGILITSCGQRGFLGGTSKKAKIKQEVDIVVDSMNYAWNEMMKADDQKLAYINRLLDEISYCEEYDEKTLTDLKKKHEELVAIRYKPTSMTNEEIDRYDLVTDQLIKETLELADKTEELESHTIVPVLKEDIVQEDADVVVYRAKYDKWAMKYNKLIKENKNKLEKAGEPYQNMEIRPLFQLEFW
ncbi:MAG: hypothetical protein ACK4ND_00760 [Cytophagaceae bacterium]